MAINPIPESMQRVTPYLLVEDVDALLNFVKDVFGATLLDGMKNPEGKTVHCEFTIGDSMIMAGMAKNSKEVTAGMLYVYVENTDATYKHALELGGTSLMEPSDQFYGDRNAGVKGPQGVSWWLASRVEEVSEEEMAKRSKEWTSSL